MALNQIVCEDRASWLEQRRRGLGASDAAAAIGVSSYRGPVHVYFDKRGIAAPDATQSLAQQIGNALEAPILELYEQRTGLPISRLGSYTILFDDRRPWMIATLDARNAHGIVEVKTANLTSYGRHDWESGPPRDYLVQVQHQMAVTGEPRAVIVALVGGHGLLEWTIERDEAFIDALIAAESAFWVNYVVPGVVPAPTSDEDAALLRKLLIPEPDTSVTLPDEAREWDRMKQDGDALIRQGKTMVESAEGLILLKMGTAAVGRIPQTDIEYRRAKVERGGYYVKPTSYTTMRRFEPKKKPEKEANTNAADR